MNREIHSQHVYINNAIPNHFNQKIPIGYVAYLLSHEMRIILK